jgi:hypothetical protein
MTLVSADQTRSKMHQTTSVCGCEVRFALCRFSRPSLLVTSLLAFDWLQGI